MKSIVGLWKSTLAAYIVHNERFCAFRMGPTVPSMNNIDASTDSEEDSDAPTAPPPTSALLEKWDEEYEAAWQNRDHRAESNDIFSLERETGK